jgi:hypothetical protein
MKKLLILILIFSAQNIFSQNTPLTVTNSEKNPVYNTAGIDIKPDFPGGYEKFLIFVDDNFKYPEGNVNLKGKKIYVTFIVEVDGSLSDIKILRDAGHGTGAEALRVLEKSPKWNPGEHHGKKIRVLFSLPITLK